MGGPIRDATDALGQEGQALEDSLERALDRALDRALESPGVERLVTRMLESRLALELTERFLDSPSLQLAVKEIAASPEVTRAISLQTGGLAEEMVAGVRRRTETLDGAAERVARTVLRRPRTDRK